jgi:hypothetical protein
MTPPQFPAYNRARFYCATISRSRASRKGHTFALSGERTPLATFPAFSPGPRNGILGER